MAAPRVPDSRTPRQTNSAVAAADALRESGARAATLVVLDDASRNKFDIELAKIMHADPAATYEQLDVSPDAVVSALIYSGVAREVWVVVPDAKWEQVASALQGLPEIVGGNESPFRRFDGVRVHYTRLRDLPVGKEPLLLLANEAELDGYDAELLARLRDPANVRVEATFDAERGR
jgi:hypothetical protein